MKEASIVVAKVTEVNAEERTYTAVLKGVRTVSHDCGGGFEVDDITEITLTVKCAMKETLQELEISEPGMAKLMGLRDRDLTLRSFEKPVPAAQREIV